MDQSQFLSTLRNLQVVVRLSNDDSLDVEAPKGVLTPELVEQIKHRKPALINYLKEIHQAGVKTQTIQAAAPAASYPLSSSQKRLWTIHEMNSDSAAYNIYQVKAYSGALNKTALEQAIHAIVERHEILRTVFKEDASGVPRQWILSMDRLTISFPCIDLRNDGNVKLEQAIDRDRFIPFQLSEWPLFRIMVFQCSDDAWMLYYNMHHIIADGWSLNVLARDIGQYYQVACGLEKQLPLPLAIQYKDYAVWQQDQLQTGVLAGHLAYWLQQLSGELPIFQLPFSKTRPAVATGMGHLLSMTIDQKLTSTLQECCRRQRASVFMGLVALLQALFFRYTGQKDIVLGTPVAGRDYPVLEDQVGFYVNTVALRIRCSDDMSFDTLLAHVRDTMLLAYEHQSYPFDHLIDQLHITRDSSRSPVFDVMVVSDNQAVPGTGDKAISDNGFTDQGIAAAKFDLTITFEDTEDSISMHVNFNTSVYDKDMITRMMTHYRQLLQMATRDAGASLSRLEYLCAEERQQLLVDFNDTRISWTETNNLLDIFETRSARFSGNRAVVYEDMVISYGELNEQSNRLSWYLRNQQVKQHDLVVICMHRSVDMITGILGILKAGAAYVPLAPDYPEDRIQHILSDCDAVTVLTQSSCRHLFSSRQELQIIEIDKDWPQIEKESCDQMPLMQEPGQLAYVIYTSGSTGKPKGVMIEQRSVVNLVNSLHEHIYKRYDGQLHIAMVAAYTFDASVKQLFASLLLGHTLYIVPDEIRSSGDLLWEYYQKNKIDISDGTPAHLFLLCQDLPAEETPVKHFLIGGEALSSELVSRFYQGFRHTAHQPVITNVYGPTEACVDSSLFTAEPEKPYPAATLPIGKPIHNVQLYILDQHLQLLPVGIQGELYIGGSGLARGYVNNEPLTNERFIQNPFTDDRSERLYRTGDLAKWLPGGQVMFTGRADDQVKIRGYRIELKEIACAIEESRLVKQCVVLAKQANDGMTSLVAYIVQEALFNRDTLIRYLKSKVPQYMIPDQFITVDGIPFTNNGKIDNAALMAATALHTSENGWDYVAPRTEAEEQLAEIVAGVLEKNKQDIGIEDSFFDLGANSITLVKIVRQINSRWKLKIKVVALFQYPNIRSLADSIFNHNTATEENTAAEEKPMDDLLSIFED